MAWATAWTPPREPVAPPPVPPRSRAREASILAGLRWTSLRLRLVVVFALVALTAAVSASGIAYWLNREAVLVRTQDAALNDFRQGMQNRAALAAAAAGRARPPVRRQADGGQQQLRVTTCCSWPSAPPASRSSAAVELDGFTLDDVPASLAGRGHQEAEGHRRPTPTRTTCSGSGSRCTATRIWSAARRSSAAGPTGYMLGPAGPGAARPQLPRLVAGHRHRSSRCSPRRCSRRPPPPPCCGRCSGSGTRRAGSARASSTPGCRVSGTDELADLSRTFNQHGRGPGEEGHRHERARGGQPPLRRRHVARAAHAADRAHRRRRGPRRRRRTASTR